MKNMFKLFGLIVLVAVIGFSFAACGGDDDGEGNGKGNGISPPSQLVGEWNSSDGQYSITIKPDGQINSLRVNAFFFILPSSTLGPTSGTIVFGYQSELIGPSGSFSYSISGNTMTISNSNYYDFPDGTYQRGSSSGGGGGTAVTNVTLNQTSLSLTVGITATLTATVSPSTATNKAVTWFSSNPNVATVNSGLVTAVSAGTATITVTTMDGNRTASCNVTVTGGGGTGTGSEANPIALTNNEWKPGSVTANVKEQWFSFPVTAGQIYRVWWDDGGGFSSGTYTGDVKVTGTHSDGTVFFTDEDHAWNESGWAGATVKQFRVNANGTVKLKVVPYSSSKTGTFAIVYSNNMFHSRPSATGEAGSDELHPILLTAGVWKPGYIATGDGELWYSINATNGNTYWVWWNDSRDGNKTYSGEVSVRAWYSDGKDVFPSASSGWTTPRSFMVDKNDTVKVRVTNSYNSPGTYAIVYSTSNTRP